MKRSWLPLRKVSFVALLAGLTVACPGGGGGGGPIPSGLVASFVAENPTPDPALMTLSMAPGPSSGERFSIRVQVTNIDDFFGAGFHVNFDPTTASFRGATDDGSFILETGVDTDISAVVNVNVPGELLVTATRQGQVAGVDPVEDDLLITLSFEATPTMGNRFRFGTPNNREVFACATPTGGCDTPIDDAMLIWSEGTMTAM